ncbi:MAG: cell division protein FtsX [Bacteroidota bacterium]
MVGLLGLLVIDARKFSDYIKEHVELTVFLKDEIQPAEVNALHQLITDAPFTKSVKYVSKEQALDSLKKELGEDAFSMLESNPLPASLDVAVKADYASADSLEKVRDYLAANEELVQEVVYQRTQVDRLQRNFDTIAIALSVFCLLLLLIALTLINNTIRLSLFSSRFLIKSMQLVGATRSFIRRPFLLRSMIYGCLSAVGAILLLSCVLYLISVKFPELGQFSQLKDLSLLFGGVLLAGVFLSGVSTLFAVNRYLRMRSEELY